MSSPTGPAQSSDESPARVPVVGGGPEVEAQFQPDQILATLERHEVEYVIVGGYAALLHGAQRPTRDVDVTPRTTAVNLQRLAAALNEMGVQVRTEAVPQGLPFSASGESLAGVRMLNLLTGFGEIDLMVHPAGFEGGWDDLQSRARTTHVGLVSVQVAALQDVITSKERAARGKDHAALPELYALAGRAPGSDRHPQEPSDPSPRTRSAQQSTSTEPSKGPPSARERIDRARQQIEEQRHGGPTPP